MRVIGLTGSIACGKTTVSNYLVSRGFPVVDGDKEVAECQNDERDNNGAVKVGAEQAAVADAAAENGYYLRVASHLGGEEDDADEDEEWAVEVDKARDEVEVITKDDFAEGSMPSKEVVEFF